MKAEKINDLKAVAQIFTCSKKHPAHSGTEGFTINRINVLKIFNICLKCHGRNLDKRLEIILDLAISSSLLCFANSSKEF
jgi:hypothetical protein